MSDYLSVDDVLAIHHDQIERYGGSSGIRDQSALESAVARPQSGYYDGVTAEAAALWENLSQNHPFVDGNKRTALMSTKVFLNLNDRVFTAKPEASIALIDDLFSKQEMNFENLNAWLGENTQDREMQHAEARETALSSARAMVEAMPPCDNRDQAEAKLNDLLGEPERSVGRNSDDDYER